MSTYDVVWVSHAEEQFNSLPPRVRVAMEQGSEFGAVGGAEFGAGAVEVALDGAD